MFLYNSLSIILMIILNLFSFSILANENKVNLLLDSKENIDYEKEKNNIYGSSIQTRDHEYLLGPGDKIKILFYEPETLTNTFEIMANGKAIIPYIGPIELNNLTIHLFCQLLLCNLFFLRSLCQVMIYLQSV